MSGWFHTGDIVRQDVDGSIFFVDRKKTSMPDAANIAGCPSAMGACCTSRRRPAAGHASSRRDARGRGFRADRARPATAEELFIIRPARSCVPGYVAFADSLPLTATQKIQRRAQDRCQDWLGDGAPWDTRAMKKRTAA
ncbi:MAG: hypothetical protein ACE368_07995 [Paracoccaceae bacterium]